MHGGLRSQLRSHYREDGPFSGNAVDAQQANQLVLATHDAPAALLQVQRPVIVQRTNTVRVPQQLAMVLGLGYAQTPKPGFCRSVQGGACRAARAAGLGADLCCADRSTLLLSSSARVGQCRKHNTCAIEIA